MRKLSACFCAGFIQLNDINKYMIINAISAMLYGFQADSGHIRILRCHERINKGETSSVFHQILVISVSGDR